MSLFTEYYWILFYYTRISHFTQQNNPCRHRLLNGTDKVGRTEEVMEEQTESFRENRFTGTWCITSCCCSDRVTRPSAAWSQQNNSHQKLSPVSHLFIQLKTAYGKNVTSVQFAIWTCCVKDAEIKLCEEKDSLKVKCHSSVRERILHCCKNTHTACSWAKSSKKICLIQQRANRWYSKVLYTCLGV